MPSVAVDLADLEALVHGTAAIKAIEATMSQRRHDPFVPAQQSFAEAHKRLVEALNMAARSSAGTAVGWDDPLTKDELILLSNLDSEGTRKVLIVDATETNKHSYDNRPFQKLLCKGCIQFGHPVTAVIWPGDDKPSEIVTDPEFWCVRLTARGRQKLASQ